MDKAVRFSAAVAEQLKCYVYRLIDPRNGATFYVGRGRGNRVFDHATAHPERSPEPDDAAKDDVVKNESLKLGLIREIAAAKFEVAHVIHRHGLDDQTAVEVEAALIQAYPGLTNVAPGSGSRERGVAHVNEIIQRYEREFAVFKHDVILINVNNWDKERDLYDQVRYAWTISQRRANDIEYVLAVRQGVIIGAFIVEEWLEANSDNFPKFPSLPLGKRKYGFRGRVAPPDICELYLQRRAPPQKRGAQGPIRYQAKSYNPEDKFTWKEGDRVILEGGTGKSLAEVQREYDEFHRDDRPASEG
jgi:hypothetical protein